MGYTHTQSASWYPVLLCVGALGALALALARSEAAWLLVSGVLGFVALIGFALSSLTTTVTPEAITTAFRWGRPRRVIAHSRVEGTEIVRNKWWYGWGIRWIPHGVMFNVWGLDAVHVRLHDSRDFRIGTDDPRGLAAAIQAWAVVQP